MSPKVGISLMLEEDLLNAADPLFESGEVEIVEWSFDMGWRDEPLPPQCSYLLDLYSRANALIGHGVSFSLLSGEWTPRQEGWLQAFAEEVSQRSYCHISEHFGFMSAGDFHRSAPLPVPLTPATLQLGQSRLKKLATFCQVPIGLENLALAFGPQDVADQGKFLKDLITPINGFLVLDLHNIYCQLYNFQIDALTLLKSYPLDLVREIHMSGGSFSHPSSSQGRPIRRDTHDEAIPEEVFDLLKLALPLCPHVEAVIFERLGNTLFSSLEAQLYREDFLRIKSLVRDVRKSACKVPSAAA